LDVHTKQGEVRNIQGNFYISILKKNLLSVGQLIEKNYKLLFDNGAWKLYNKHSVRKLLAIAPMIKTKMFLINIIYRNLVDYNDI
jgi:hypothetical protein